MKSHKDDVRPKSECIAEIKTYNGKLATTERLEDLKILSNELGSDYEVRHWLFNKHLRVVVLKGGYQL